MPRTPRLSPSVRQKCKWTIGEKTKISEARNLVGCCGLYCGLNEQRERQALVEELLRSYNDGRSMSFYCKICGRMEIESINKVIKETRKKLSSEKADESDMKSKAKILKAVVNDSALKANANLN